MNIQDCVELVSSQLNSRRDQIIYAVLSEELGLGAVEKALRGGSNLRSRVHFTHKSDGSMEIAIDGRKVLWVGPVETSLSDEGGSVSLNAKFNYKDLREAA